MVFGQIQSEGQRDRVNERQKCSRLFTYLQAGARQTVQSLPFLEPHWGQALRQRHRHPLPAQASAHRYEGAREEAFPFSKWYSQTKMAHHLQ